MRALLIAFLYCATPIAIANAMPKDTGGGGPIDTGAESDADADADADTDTDTDADADTDTDADTDSSGGSSSGVTVNGQLFDPPDDDDGIKTTGAPKLSAEGSGGCGGSAFVVAPLLLLGLRRRP